jgi:hypothetical protein
MKALGSIIQVAGDQVLPIAAETLSVVPIPALVPVAKILDDIWKSVNAVQVRKFLHYDYSSALRTTCRQIVPPAFA